MNSPSSSVTMRMIPCIAGWAGPTPTCSVWPLPVPLPSPSMNSRVVTPAPVGSAITRHLRPSRLGPDQGLAPVDGVVLAQRVPDELLVHQQAAQVRMTGEAHAEHVPHLALE